MTETLRPADARPSEDPRLGSYSVPWIPQLPPTEAEVQAMARRAEQTPNISLRGAVGGAIHTLFPEFSMFDYIDKSTFAWLRKPAGTKKDNP